MEGGIDNWSCKSTYYVGCDSGNVGPDLVNVGRDSGNVGRDSGNVGRDSGNVGHDSGSVGRDSEFGTTPLQLSFSEFYVSKTWVDPFYPPPTLHLCILLSFFFIAVVDPIPSYA